MILTAKNADDSSFAPAGGKGASLLRLAKAGYPVPPFVIIPSVCFNNEGKLEPEILNAVTEYFHTHTLLAVRSSASLEDSAEHSFAGQFSTRLNVTANELKTAIQAVWQSADNERVIAYKQAQQIDASHQMSVIVQQMIPATASGVAFGLNPRTGNASEIVINAINGIGEALVNGSVNADEYICSGVSVSKKMGGDYAVLTDEQLHTIIRTSDSLGEKFGCPQDIEFAFENDTFWLLQARSVTTLQKRSAIIWDNSNIVESYPGLTLPLTFSFIEKMYAAVYRQFSGIMGVDSKTILTNEAVYNTMLGLLNGRVYYNLNSWFTALAQLPGYTLNADFMERMMGVKEKFPIQIKTEKRTRFQSYLAIAGALAHILKNLVTARKQRREFIGFFDEVYTHYDAQDFSKKPLAEIVKNYQSFEQLMLGRWKAPLVNDFFAMIYFGLLQKFTDKHALSLHNDLVASSHDIITTQPAKLLPALAKRIAEDEDLRQHFLTENPTDVLIYLQQPAHQLVKKQFDQYISEWGDRSLAELKLETVTYRQQPQLLVQVLQAYVRQELFLYNEQTQTDKRREAAEIRLQQILRSKPVKKWLIGHVVKQARYFISNRENLRYYRTKGFGMVRRLMLAAGSQLQQQKRIEKATDIFYLKLEEITSVHSSPFFELIAARKKEYTLYEKLDLPERMTTYGRPDKLILPPPKPEEAAENRTTIGGLACSPGVVRATVRLVTHPSQIDTMNGCILATYSTDPGWVVLFPSAAGILTERGSLLSHAAIVSREMGLPCIVGISGLMNQVRDGDDIVMDGSTGQVKILNR